FTYDEPQVIATARIADRLGLPGLSAAGAQRCRNKYETRLALTAAGLPQPRFRLVDTAEDAGKAAATLGYPVVLKPRGMAASIGVVRVEGPGEGAAAFEGAERASRGGPGAFRGGALGAGPAAGPEPSIDGAVVAGQYLPFCLAHKQLGLPPYFEEVGHLVDGADPLLADADLRQVLEETHRALGLRYG